MSEATGSRYLRLERFRSMMRRHIDTPGRFDGDFLIVDASTDRFLSLVGGPRAKALQVESVVGSLFASGWGDLSIRVFQAELFDRAMSLGEEYEQLTQQAVTLICYF